MSQRIHPKKKVKKSANKLVSTAMVLGGVTLVCCIFIFGTNFDSALIIRGSLLKDWSAAHDMGKRYYNGDDVERDVARGIMLTEKAVDASDRNTQLVYELAVMLEKGGPGVQPDYARAFALHQEAANAEPGYPPSILALGKMYQDGRGVDKNTSDALSQLRRAAETGYPEAEIALSRFLASPDAAGWRDESLALAWAYVARYHGHPDAPDLVKQLERQLSGPKVREADRIFSKIRPPIWPPPKQQSQQP